MLCRDGRITTMHGAVRVHSFARHSTRPVGIQPTGITKPEALSGVGEGEMLART
jgi:hypothetical protein